MAKSKNWVLAALHDTAIAAARRRVEVAAMNKGQKAAADAVGKAIKSIGGLPKRGGQPGYEKLYQGGAASLPLIRRALKDIGFTFDADHATSDSTSLWFQHPTLGRVRCTVNPDGSNNWTVSHILPIR